MIDVGAKPATERVAVARASVAMAKATRALVASGQVEKGDVLAAARLAGVMAAKRTPDLVPLCHPIALSGVEMDVRLTSRGVEEAAALVRRHGSEGLLLGSDAGESGGDLLALPRAADRLARAGLSLAVLRRACLGNALAWLGLSLDDLDSA